MSRKEERLYWLKLHKSYFNQLSQKKMKKQEDGRVMQVIYLQMMLLSIDTEATIYYQGVFDTIEEELAAEFDESVELVRKTIDYLTENRLATFINKDECDFFLPEANGLIGSEGGSTERVRRYRERKKALQCNDTETDCNDTETDCNDTETDCNGETETETEKRERDRYISTETETETNLSDSVPSPVSDKYTLDDILECVREGKVKITDEGAKAFYRQIKADGWRMYGKPIENLLRAVREYAKKHPGNDQATAAKPPNQPRKNTFHNFEQREGVDYDDLEEKLLGKTRKGGTL